MYTSPTRLLRIVGAVALPLLCLASMDARAGNLFLTGHDLDFHCSGGAGCGEAGIAFNFVRQGAPTKTLPILVLDEGGQVALAMAQPNATAKNTVEGAGVTFPSVVIAPSSAAFATTPINVATYSAVVIASDSTCGGCDNNTASITAINARTADLQAFFSAGGGLLYLAGAGNRATYYNSVPIPAAAAAVSPPFTVTPAGAALGITTADANCCATHNSFSLPGSGSPLVVAETDSAALAETLFVSGGSICGGSICGGGASTEVPTMSEWALIVMATLVLLVGVVYVRRRGQGPPVA
jgi:hypothetical protein